MTTATATREYRARVRCNACFKNSWITAKEGDDCNHHVCGVCGAAEAVDFKRIYIKEPRQNGPKCGAKCQASISGVCECTCGGKNHGSSR